MNVLCEFLHITSLERLPASRFFKNMGANGECSRFASLANATALALVSVLTLFSPRSLLCAENVPQPPPAFITVGTGPLNALYYPAGRAICTLVNQDRALPRILCSVQRTRGSIYNIKGLAAGEFEFCIAQSDQLVSAYYGRGAFREPLKELRIVAALFEESFTVAVRADSPIQRISDLKNRRISTGFPGSGGYATFHMLMKSMDWDFSDIERVDTINNTRALHELCAGKLDGVVLTAGHPYRSLVIAARECDLRLLEIRGKAVNRLLAASPVFMRTVIPGGLYRGIPRQVKSIGVVAILATSSSVDDEVVCRILKAMAEHVDVFRKACPVFGSITKEGLLRDFRSVPLHEGVARFYHENGLVPLPELQDRD